MALQRHLENLRSRPHHERRAIAAMVSLGVVGVLTFVSVVFFFTNLDQTVQAQTAAADARAQQAAAAEEAAEKASSTSYDLDTAQQLQVMEVGSQ